MGAGGRIGPGVVEGGGVRLEGRRDLEEARDGGRMGMGVGEHYEGTRMEVIEDRSRTRARGGGRGGLGRGCGEYLRVFSGG